jgi:hypothetical protein
MDVVHESQRARRLNLDRTLQETQKAGADHFRWVEAVRKEVNRPTRVYFAHEGTKRLSIGFRDILQACKPVG